MPYPFVAGTRLPAADLNSAIAEAMVALPGLTLASFGAVGNGITDDTAAINAWVLACSTQGLPGRAGPGTYMSSGFETLLVGDTILYLDIGCVIKGTAGLSTSVFAVDGQAGRFRFHLYGPGAIDNSLTDYIPADASGTCLALTRIDDFVIDGVSFLSTNDYRDEKGDSGIATATCARGVIRHCYFRGQPDLGVYLSGGSSTGPADDYGDQTVEDCVFYRCQGAAAIKRSGHRTSFINNSVIECRVGFSAQIHQTPINLPAPQELIVSGNFFKKNGSRVVDTDAFCRTVFTNNIVDDWGYTPEGTIPGPGLFFPWAVSIQTQNSVYSNNIIGFRDWSGTGPGGELMEAFRLSDIDYYDGATTVTYEAINNVIDNNTIIDTPIGIRELNNSTSNVGDNMFVNVVTPIMLAVGSTSHFGLRTDAGLNQPFLSSLAIGKTAFTITAAGLTADTGFSVYHTVDGTAGGGVSAYRINRLVTDGPLMTFYKDGAIGGAIGTHATLGVELSGTINLVDFTVATLPAASACISRLAYVSDGASNKKVVVSDGTVWRYMDGVAV